MSKPICVKNMSLFALEYGAEPHLAHHDAGVSSNARAMEVGVGLTKERAVCPGRACYEFE